MNFDSKFTECERGEISLQYKQLTDSHKALESAHEQLAEYSDQVEELTLIRERNRIAREIHDTVGHKMTALLFQLQLAKETVKHERNDEKERLATCEQLTREALEEIRLSVRTLKEDDYLKISIVHVLQELLQDFSILTGLETELDIDGDPSLVPSHILPTIKRIVQESITNVKRHSQATRCSVDLKITNEALILEICDNGRSIGSFVPGFGLINMQERVVEHGGILNFICNRGEGFSVNVTIPIKSLKWRSVGVE